MEEVTFHLKTITPLFMAGAEYNFIEIPEDRRQPERKGRNLFAKYGWELQPEI